MPIPLLGAIGPLADLVGKAMDRWLPARMSEAEKTEARQQAVAWVREQAFDEDKAFRDFVVQYEGSGAEVNWAIQTLRGSVRPVLTYFLAGAYVWGFLHPATFTQDVMQGLFQLNLVSLGFWYSERAVRRLLQTRQARDTDI